MNNGVKRYASEDQIIRSWNQLEDRPFGEEIIEGIDYIFDGNLGDREVLTCTIDDNSEKCIKISDIIPVEEQLQSLTFTFFNRQGYLSSEYTWANWDMLAYKDDNYEYKAFDIPSKGMHAFAYIIIVKTSEGAEILGLPETGMYHTTYQTISDNQLYDYVSELHMQSANVVKQLDEKYIPDTIARKEYVDNTVANASIQPDWNQNDETASDYVKNRPFYTEQETKIVLTEITYIDCTEDGVPVTLENPLEDRMICTVMWNGVEYTCTAFAFSPASDINLIMLGNRIVDTGEDTGEPFLFFYNKTEDLNVFIPVDGSTTVTTSIVGIAQTIHKLDEKYIPDSIQESINKQVGRKVERIVYTIDGEEVIAGVGAEVFNIYKKNADGDENIASGSYSHAEGYDTTASGHRSHAEGYDTTASGWNSHAEGGATTASGFDSHAEGSSTTASGYTSHAEGYNTTASGDYSHAEGGATTASGLDSHAEGWGTTASGDHGSHAEGWNTIASGDCQHVQGKYNINDIDTEGNPLNTYAHIVGNGTTEDAPSNANTLDWEGNAWYAGDVYVGSTSGTNRDEGSKKLASEEYVDNAVANAGVVFTVNITENTDDEGNITYSADKTFAEIVEAHESGKVVVAKYHSLYLPLYDADIEGEFCFMHSSVPNYQEVIVGDGYVNMIDIDLLKDFNEYGFNTEDKTIVGAINELNAKHTEGTDQLILSSPNGTRFSITVGDDGVLTATEIE